MHKDVPTCFLFYFHPCRSFGPLSHTASYIWKGKSRNYISRNLDNLFLFIMIHYYDVLSILNSKNRLIFYRCINNTYNCCLLCQHMDGSYCVKPLKQKQVVNTSAFLLSLHLTSFCVATSFFWQRHTKALFPPWNSRLARESGRLYSSLCSFSQVDGVSYLLQEIYGIENKYNSQESKVEIGKHMKRFRAL